MKSILSGDFMYDLNIHSTQCDVSILNMIRRILNSNKFLVNLYIVVPSGLLYANEAGCFPYQYA